MRPLGLFAILALAPAARAAEPVPAADAARIDSLVRKLGARYLDDRQAARSALEKVGAAAGPALLASMGDADVRIRQGACELLGAIRFADATPRLVDLLGDEALDVREAARDALIRIGLPAHDAIRNAQRAGRIDAATAEAILDRPLRAAVEAALDACISRDFGWGFYRDQFKDLLAMGPPVAAVLLRLFTTPPAEYAFIHEVGGAKSNGPGAEYRKLIIQRLAGEALAEMRDPSVLPGVRAFAHRLEKEGVDLFTEDAKGDLYKTAACILRRLGEPATYEAIVGTLRKEAGVSRPRPDGDPVLEPARESPVRQIEALSELAMLLVKNEAIDEAVWAYRQIIDRGTRLVAPSAESDQAPPAASLHAHVKSAHYNLACALSLAGRKEEAIASLRRAVEWGYRDVEWIKRDRDLDAIREEAGYRELLLHLERDRRRLEALQHGEMPEDP
mgnify:CR=1 FL=1